MRLKWGNVEVGYISGLVSQEEGIRLAELAADVPPDLAIVEVGAHGGTSVCWLAMGVHKGGNHAQIYAIDLWDTPELLGRAPKHMEKAVYRRFKAQIDYCGSADFLTPKDIHAIKGESTAVAAEWDKPIGLLHIDALHTYEACAADLDAWTSHVVKGGILVVHDYHDPRFGVRKAMDERLEGWKVLGAPRWEWRPNRRGQLIVRKA